MAEGRSICVDLVKAASSLLGGPVGRFVAPGLPVPIPLGLAVVLALEARRRLGSRTLFSTPVGKVQEGLKKVNDEIEMVKMELMQARRNLEDMERGLLEGNVELAKQSAGMKQGSLDELEDTKTILNMILIVREQVERRKAVFKEDALKKLDKQIDKVPDGAYEKEVGKALGRLTDKKDFVKELKSFFESQVQ